MKKTIIAAAVLVAMTACNKNVIEMTPSEGYGYIDLGVTADTEMVITKAATEMTDEQLAGYNVILKKGSEEVWTREFSAITADDLKQPAGTYTLYVENLTVEETYISDKGVVRVSGENNVTVTAGLSSLCTVACTPQNSKVSFITTADFDTVFDNPAVSVKESDSRTVAMTVGSTHTGADCAYFEPGTLTWTLTAQLGGQTKTYTKVFTAKKAKWTQVTFTTGSTDGQIDVTITVDGEIVDVETITAVVDPFSDAVEIPEN